MLQAIAQEGLRRFKYLVVDCLYGNSPDFLDAVDACRGVTALVALLEAVSAEVFQHTLRGVFCPSDPLRTVHWPKAREVAENEGEAP
jgi:hypothetical protein